MIAIQTSQLKKIKLKCICSYTSNIESLWMGIWFLCSIFKVPSEEILSVTPHIYFADFYCMGGKIHYVTLVATKPDSMADRFCRECLLLLPLDNETANPFMFFRDQGELYVNAANNFLVEVFYTEHVDIPEFKRTHRALYLTGIPLRGRGRSKRGGKPKNPSCKICNLPRSGELGLRQI